MPNTHPRKFSPALLKIWETGKVEHPTGDAIGVCANISKSNANALYDLIVSEKPRLVIEIGMAYGVSTLTILSALAETGSGKLISIDPYIGWPTGMKVAAHQIEKAGFSGIHTHIHEPSQLALPRLWGQGLSPDFIYIDGYHNVEYVMTDCFYSDKIIRKGGIIGFNDCGWRAVFKVLKFLNRHRRYEELDIHRKTYASRNLLFSLVKRIEGRSSPDRFFRKLEDWEPESGFFRNF